MIYLLVLLSLIAISFSATITVDDAGDSDNPGDGKCNLREALKIANTNSISTYTECQVQGTLGNDTINFAQSLNGQVITLSSSLSVDFTGGNLTIDGSGVRVSISGNNTVQLFTLTGSGTLEIRNLNLINGRSTTNGSVVAVGSGRTLKISNSFIGYNNATGNGTIYNNGGTVEITNCTFANNTAPAGSIVYNNAGITRIAFITASGNSADALAQAGGTLQVKNSIFDHTGNLCAGTVQGFGVLYSTSIGGCTGFTQKTQQELALDTLDYHGGSTRVYKLNSSSVAINSVTDCTDILVVDITKDQRGKDRNKNNKKCDAGAFEALYNVSVGVQPSGSGTVSGDGEYEHGADVSLTANPSSGYEFDGWLGDCSSCTNATCILTNIAADKTCTAKFKQSQSQQPPPDNQPPPPLPDNLPPLPYYSSTTSPAGSILLQTDANILAFESFQPPVSPPPGYAINYPAFRIRVQVANIARLATVRLILPTRIPAGSRVYKLVGNQIYDITSQVSILGSTITFVIYDNSIYDADSTDLFIEDPIVILENLNPPVESGGGGGCNAGASSNLWAWLFVFGMAVLRKLRTLS